MEKYEDLVYRLRGRCLMAQDKIIAAQQACEEACL